MPAAFCVVNMLTPSVSPAQDKSQGGGPGGPGSGTGGGRWQHTLPAGGDPLGLAPDADCDAGAKRAAQPFLQVLRGYVTAYEARKALPSTPGYKITAHPATANSQPRYWLDIEPENVAKVVASGQVVAIFKCSYITTFARAEARDRGIAPSGNIFLGYAPHVGIFSVRRG